MTLRRAVAVTIAVTGFVVFGNVADAVIGRDTFSLSWSTAAKAAVVLALVVGGRSCCGLRWRQLGIVRDGLLRSAIVGLVFAFSVACALLGALRWVPLPGGHFQYSPDVTGSDVSVLEHALIGLPLLTVLPEELAFRGLMMGALRCRLSAVRATVVTVVAFTVWHAWVQYQTLLATNLGTPLLMLLAGLVAGLGLAAGAAVFAWIRLRTDNLAGAIAAHWAFDATVILGLHFA